MILGGRVKVADFGNLEFDLWKIILTYESYSYLTLTITNRLVPI